MLTPISFVVAFPFMEKINYFTYKQEHVMMNFLP